MSKLRVLELYSGIGGMHWALKESGIPYEVVMAVDINTTANLIYEHNFPKVNLHSFGLEKLTLKKLASLSCNAILMSPPCQPFTRVGKKADCDDVRTKSFLQILQLIREIDCKPGYILVENVKGFEESRTRQLLVEMLQDCGYSFQEFLLNPLQFGIPNSRLRYYLTAKQTPWHSSFKPFEQILLTLPNFPIDTSHNNEAESNKIPKSILHDSSPMTTVNVPLGTPDTVCSSDLPCHCHHQATNSQICTVNQFSSGDNNCDIPYGEAKIKETAGHSDKDVLLGNSAKHKSCSCASVEENTKSSSGHTRNSYQDNEQSIQSDVKKLKTDMICKHDNFCSSGSETTASLEQNKVNSSCKDKVPKLIDAGRNMRYCEEDDDMVKDDCHQLCQYIESGAENDFQEYLLPDKNLLLFVVMDVVLPSLKKSTCFTKRYGRYIEGAGSVVQMSSSVEDTKAASDLKSRAVSLKNNRDWGEEELSIVRKLKLRYFTPREVANLLCFPSDFTFPDGLSNVQKYRVLGNSLNVHVVSELIKFMFVT